MFGPIVVQVSIRKREAAGKRLTGGLETQIPEQLLIAEVCSILVGHPPFSKSLVGDGEGELAVLGLRIDDQISVVPAPGLRLKTKILDLHDCGFLVSSLPDCSGLRQGAGGSLSSYSLVTFCACNPSGPLATVNSTASPSASDL